jgi:hypothetical protein
LYAVASYAVAVAYTIAVASYAVTVAYTIAVAYAVAYAVTLMTIPLADTPPQSLTYRKRLLGRH